MKSVSIEKGVAVAVILLFIGVSVAPSINISVVKATADDDFVEVTSETCGITGYGNTTVKLTKQQYNKLNQYIVEFRAELNTTVSRDEASLLFIEAIVELNKFGLLPRGMSIQQAQRLVTGQNQYERPSQKQKSDFFDENENAFCMLAGQTTDTRFIPTIGLLSGIPLVALCLLPINCFFFLIEVIIHFLQDLSALFSSEIIKAIIDRCIGRLEQVHSNHYDVALIPIFLYALFFFVNPFRLFNAIFLGGYSKFPSEYYNAAHGWINSIGLNGRKTWNGSLYGAQYAIGPSAGGYFLGVFGFTGLRVSMGEIFDYFYLGSAVDVKISSDPIYI